MRIGISFTSSYTVADPREGARWMIERAAAAERAGLDSLFVGDHHATPSPYYQSVPMLGRMLAEWTDRPAGCLFLLPLWNPVLIAEQVGTLVAIARGRFIFQCGLGDGERSSSPWAPTSSSVLPPSRRPSRSSGACSRARPCPRRGASSSRTRACPPAPSRLSSTGSGRARAYRSIAQRASPTAGSPRLASPSKKRG